MTAKPEGGARLEVHEHSFVRGRFGHVVHSHEGGKAPHEHPDTGPASYTIDKDEWARATGLRGGGRKRYTAKPSGEQFALVPRKPQSFDVFILDSALVNGEDGNLRPIRPEDDVSGGGVVEQMLERKFGLTARVHDLRSRAAPSAAMETREGEEK